MATAIAPEPLARIHRRNGSLESVDSIESVYYEAMSRPASQLSTYQDDSDTTASSEDTVVPQGQYELDRDQEQELNDALFGLQKTYEIEDSERTRDAQRIESLESELSQLREDFSAMMEQMRLMTRRVEALEQASSKEKETAPVEELMEVMVWCGLDVEDAVGAWDLTLLDGTDEVEWVEDWNWAGQLDGKRDSDEESEEGGPSEPGQAEMLDEVGQSEEANQPDEGSALEGEKNSTEVGGSSREEQLDGADQSNEASQAIASDTDQPNTVVEGELETVDHSDEKDEHDQESEPSLCKSDGEATPRGPSPVEEIPDEHAGQVLEVTAKEAAGTAESSSRTEGDSAESSKLEEEEHLEGTSEPGQTTELGVAAHSEEADGADDTSKPEEVVEPEAVLKPEEAAKPEETIKSEETIKPEETIESEETTKLEETIKSEEAIEPEETTKPEETIKSEETTEPEATIESEGVTKLEEATESKAAAKSAEVTQPKGKTEPEEASDSTRTSNLKPNHTGITATRGTPIPCPYFVGAKFRLRVSPPSGTPYEVRVTVVAMYNPFTISPILRVSPDTKYVRLPVDLPHEIVLKLYDRRFAHSLREHYKGKPPTVESETQYQQYLASGPAANHEELDDRIGAASPTGLEGCPPHLFEHFVALAMDSFHENECAAYKRLANLQGRDVPSFYGSVRVMDGDAVQGVLLEAIQGSSLGTIDPRSVSVGAAVRSAIRIIDSYYDLGLLNQRVHLGNFMIKPDGSVVMVDFAQARLRGKDESDEEWRMAKREADEAGCIEFEAQEQFDWSWVRGHQRSVRASLSSAPSESIAAAESEEESGSEEMGELEETDESEVVDDWEEGSEPASPSGASQSGWTSGLDTVDDSNGPSISDGTSILDSASEPEKVFKPTDVKIKINGLGTATTKGTLIPCPYFVGAKFRLRVSPLSGTPYEIRVTVVTAYTPFTVSPVMRVTVDSNYAHTPVDLPAELILKVYDRRFARSIREHYMGKPATHESEAQYQQYLASTPAADHDELDDEINALCPGAGYEECPPHFFEHLVSFAMSPYYENECAAYERLARLQGRDIPIFYGSVQVLDGGSVRGVLLEAVPGVSLDKADPARVDIGAAIGNAMRIVHSYYNFGLLHEDVRLSNFLVKPDGSVAMIDFTETRLRGEDEGDEDWRNAKRESDEERRVAFQAQKKFGWP